MVNEKLCFIGQDDLLLRFVDDFMFVSPCLEKAKHFLSIMEQGKKIPQKKFYDRAQRVWLFH
jgi:hypothetical protein